MGFLDEYRKLQKKREEEVKNSSKKTTQKEETKKSSGSSFMEQYNALKSERGTLTVSDDDIAPVKDTKEKKTFLDVLSNMGTALAKQQYYQNGGVYQSVETQKAMNDFFDDATVEFEEDEKKWFDKGAFEDGYQEGDVTKTVGGSSADLMHKITSGILGVGEKAVDALAYIAPIFAQGQYYQNGGAYQSPEIQKMHNELYEDAKKESAEFIAKDLYDEREVAKKLISNVASGAYLSNITMNGGMLTQADIDYANQVKNKTQSYLINDMEKSSVFAEKSDELLESAGQLMATAGLGAVGVPWWLTTGVTSFGAETESALNQGATYEEAGVSGLISAGAEMLTEKISGGISFGGKTLDDVLTKHMASLITDKTARALAKVGVDLMGEGAEEILSGYLGAIGQKLTYADEKQLKELFSSEDAMDAFIGGAILGGVSSAGNVANSAIKGVDSVTGMTKNEQAVFDKVYEAEIKSREENGAKLTEKDKSNIYDETLRRLEKGQIDIDTIESVLGGETYKTYKDTVDSEDALTKEFEELGQTSNPTLAQTARYNELSEQIKEMKEKSNRNQLKEQLSKEVSEMALADRLGESYRDRARRSQVFEADLTQYDAKQAEVVKKAVDSGILNNSSRTHDFVDMIAKISAEKGVSFDFTNNEKLMTSGFAVEGKTVNGFVTDGNVTLNIDSAKSLNSVVGHEITHVLEGTEFYTELQNLVTEYAKTKGEYDTRLQSLTKLYENVKDANIEAELTADLVGDYLFTDADFINNLSVENRNIFEKIFDEIKYLCKVATAGSKEARELEKVKRAFEKAYRETETNNEANELSDAEVKYSIREEAPPKNTDIAYKVFYVKDGKLYPPMVANPDGADTPMGVWLNADVGTSAPPSKTGRAQVKAGGKGTQGGSGSLAFRPGWHLGDLPRASQFDRVNPETGKKELFPENFVWAEVEYAKDVDYQEEAMSYGYTDNGKFRHAYAGLPRLPENGYYRYRTNPKPDTVPWVITGAMKVNRLLSDAEVNEILEKNGVPAVHRQGGDVGLEKFGFGNDGTVQYSLADSDGNQLTKEQSEYFKDSKVRDENGSLKPVYHGSTSMAFTEFNVENGVWLSETQAYSEFYSSDWHNWRDDYEGAPTRTDINGLEKEVYTDDDLRVYKLYADIRNPFNIGEINSILSEGKVRELATSLGMEVVNQTGNNKDGAKIASEVRKLAKRYLGERTYSFTRTKKFIDYVKKLGYDGFEATERGIKTYCVFNSADQVKLVSNQTPTSDTDIRYSLSEDSEGRELSPSVKNRFAKSKVVDDSGSLKVVYHGTASGEFSIFDKSKGSVEGDFGSGFYFTDNEDDVSEHYEGGGPDFDNKVARRAEQIQDEEDIDYDEAEERARAELFKGGHKFEVYLNIENPAIVGKTILFDNESYLENYNEEDYEDYDDYIADVEQSLADDIENIVWEVEKNVDVYSTDGLADVLYNAYYEGGIGIEELKAKINDLYLEDEYGNLVGNEVARQIIESLGYDGIIDPTVSGKWNMDMEEGTTHYIVFKPNQIKAVTNQNPTDNPDIHLSLSEKGSQVAPVGIRNTYGRDIALPTRQSNIGAFEDSYAPLTETEANVRDDRQIEDHYFADYVEPEAEEGYNGNYADHVKPSDPFYEKDIWEVGKDRKQKAYMYENPEVKPFFQAEARMMLGELDNSVKGERIYNDQLYYDTNGEQGFFGTKRHTSEDIAYLLDTFNYTYKDIAKGLNAIIEDNGKENNAISKRIEFLLDERLRSGYKDFWFGDRIPPNQDYINLLNSKEITEYNDEAWNNWLRSLTEDEINQYFRGEVMTAPLPTEYAPAETAPIESAPVEEAPIIEAPTTEKSVAIRPKPTKEPRMTRVKDVPTEEAPVAQVLTEEEAPPKRKNRFWTQAMELLGDKGFVFENLAKKTKNRELEGKWNSTRYAEGKAQKLIGEGADGVRALNDIQKEIKGKGLEQALSEYVYHVHNIDRMTLEERYEDTTNKAVFGDNVTADVSREAVAELEKAHPELKQYAEEIYAYNNYLRKLLVDGGVISQETADLWAEMYPHYVPISRVDKNGLNINVPLDTRKTGVNAPVKRAVGGNSNIRPLFTVMAERTAQTYRAVARNRFGVELKNTLGSVVSKETANVDSVIDGVEAHEELLQKGKNGSNPTFTVFENGEKVTFEITEDMYDALKPMNETLAYTNPVLNRLSNIHRGVLTEYNPAFLMSNAIKDTQDVLINSQHPARTYANFPSAIKEMATNGKWYREYLENGGEQNTYFDKQTNAFVKEKTGFKKLVGMPLDAISIANNTIERLPRLAEYIASRKAGRSIDVSMLDSARVTTNFSAGGDLTKFLNRNGATFLNASVQGAMQHVRNVREAKMNGLKGWTQLATKVALAGLPAILLNSLLWDDDEEYADLSDYVKQNYYVIAKYGDGQFVRIPKGRALAVIQNAFEQTMNSLTGDDELDLSTFLELAVSNLAPNNPIENNIIAPIIQVKNNETWYGEDLVPTRLQDLPANEQFDESTDTFSKWLGEKTNMSPYKINYLLNQYSGGVGDMILPMLTPEAESGDNSLMGNLLAPIKSKFTTDSVSNNQNISDFYDMSDTLTTNAKRSGATDEDVLKNKYFNSISAEMSELYARQRAIQNGNLVDSQKHEKVRELQKQIDALAEEALNSYEVVNIDGTYATVGDVEYRKTDSGWEKLTDKQIEKQDNVTSDLGISPSEYWSNKEEYDFAYEYAEKYAFFKENDMYEKYVSADEDGKRAYNWAYENPKKYTASKVIADDVVQYRKYTSELSDIRADKDANGKTIVGSAKEKKKAYIFSLDLDYGQKILMYRMEYDSQDDKDTYNADIVEYLDSRDDVSYEEMVEILEELGMKVYPNGRVTW